MTEPVETIRLHLAEYELLRDEAEENGDPLRAGYAAGVAMALRVLLAELEATK